MILPLTADDTSALSSSEVLARICSGDAEALGWFYDRWQGPVHAFVARLVRGSEAQERVVEAVFWAVWERAGSHHSSSVDQWLHALSISCCRVELEARLAERRKTADQGAAHRASGLLSRSVLAGR